MRVYFLFVIVFSMFDWNKLRLKWDICGYVWYVWQLDLNYEVVVYNEGYYRVRFLVFYFEVFKENLLFKYCVQFFLFVFLWKIKLGKYCYDC